MNYNKIQNMLDKTNFWDAEVNELTCSYFGDEIKMTYEDNITCTFVGCYKIVFNHEINYKKFKAIKDYNESQMPYFLHEISVSEKIIKNETFYEVIVSMPPALNLEILCKDIVVIENNFE